jgi:hypothetical protein
MSMATVGMARSRHADKVGNKGLATQVGKSRTVWPDAVRQLTAKGCPGAACSNTTCCARRRAGASGNTTRVWPHWKAQGGSTTSIPSKRHWRSQEAIAADKASRHCAPDAWAKCHANDSPCRATNLSEQAGQKHPQEAPRSTSLTCTTRSEAAWRPNASRTSPSPKRPWVGKARSPAWSACRRCTLKPFPLSIATPMAFAKGGPQGQKGKKCTKKPPRTQRGQTPRRICPPTA